MRAAVYARKSTSEGDVTADAKSVRRQVEHSRIYAERKGWTVADAHIYSDDAISGAEFLKRPGFQRLMQSLQPRSAFDVLIMSESSRLGREAWETGFALKQILKAGVRVFFYMEDRECSFEHPIDKLQFSIVQAFDEMERTRASQRATDKWLQLMRAGKVPGGRLYGYDNVRGADGFVERVVNKAEAAIVRRIFERSAAGEGLSRIAKRLNAEHVSAPRAQQGRPSGWSPSTVRAVLLRDTIEASTSRIAKRNATAGASITSPASQNAS
jgi:site-specific DNA recombinase